MKRKVTTAILAMVLICLVWAGWSMWEQEGNIPLSTEEEAAPGGRIPMVYVNDQLYYISTAPGQQTYSAQVIASSESVRARFVYLGQIAENIDLPVKNFQANYDPVGTEIYQYEENIALLINGYYCMYEPAE